MRGKPAVGLQSEIRTRIIPAHAGQTVLCFCSVFFIADHPRACGANAAIRRSFMIPSGSSPRMRGKLVSVAVLPVFNRIIPAHAGQTMACTPSMPNLSDHPRACGANNSVAVISDAPAGSSPRMRGKLNRTSTPMMPLRIIPAHAGQTPDWRGRAHGTTDHPRACGANFAGNEAGWARAGSSPRMRGKHLAAVGDAVAVRIIPAHAGQTAYRSQGPSRPSDHPRACGANEARLASESHAFGSSPRMRGKPAARSRRVMRVRIIPAHAGQTSAAARAGWSRPDHPRACGANVLTLHLHHAASGSSPRMRGKRQMATLMSSTQRIIPAHAGQTSRRNSSCYRQPDHPRACGANEHVRFLVGLRHGSSPRMRGKRYQRPPPPRQRRIIPAHAGQTPPSTTRDICRPDHPRACGANAARLAPRRFPSGSSTRMRGKRYTRSIGLDSQRIIPAHAGQTC